MPKAKKKSSKKRPVKAMGTPHQWAYANQLAKRAGIGGVGKAVKAMGIKKPKKFLDGVKSMHGVIADLETALGVKRRGKKIVSYGLFK